MKTMMMTTALVLTTIIPLQNVSADSISLTAVPSHTITVEGGHIEDLATRERREFPMHSARIDRKQHKLASRVEYARKAHKISYNEYQTMQNIMRQIHLKEAYMKRDLRLNKREISRLNKMLNKANKRLTKMIRS